MTKIIKLNAGTKAYELALLMDKVGDETIAERKALEEQSRAIGKAASERQEGLLAEITAAVGVRKDYKV